MQEMDQGIAEGAFQREGCDAKPQNPPDVNGFFWMRFLLLRLDAIAALAIAAMTAAFRLSGSKAVYIPRLNMLDDSWALDIAYRFSRGSWLGKDVVFTYGPLYEFMVGLPARLLHQPEVGSLYRTWETIPICLSIALVYGTGILLLDSEPAWKRCVFLVGIIFFCCPLNLRPLICVFTLAVLVRTMASLSSSTVLRRAAAISLLMIGASLVSADAGIYSAATFVVVVFWAFCFERRRRREIGLFCVTTTALVAAWMLVLNAILGSLLDFQFWRINAAQIGNYRWGQPEAMDLPMGIAMVFIAYTTALFTLRSAWMLRRADVSVLARRPFFLCSGFCVAILYLQSGLVRSDWEHVSQAMFPAIVIIAITLMGTGSTARRSTWIGMGVALLIAAFVSFALMQRLWGPYLLRNNLVVQRVNGACPVGTKYFQQACLGIRDAEILSRAESFLAGSAAPKAIVFPYQNVLAVTAGKLAAGRILQSYAANGELLMQQQLQSLQNDRPELAIYGGVDDFTSWDIDQVSNFSRSPDVWFFLQRNYRFDSVLARNFLGLRKDEERAKKWKESREEADAFRPKTLNVSSAGVYDFGAVSWNNPYDFIRLELRFRYPIWWKLSKPSAVAVLLQLSDGSVREAHVVLPPNKDTELWIFPWEEADLSRYFLTDPHQWRGSGVRPTVTRLAIRIAPYDAISVLPNAIEIRRVQAVSLTLQ
jgi:hypothetical protein